MLKDALDTDSANTFAETLKNAGFSPWQLIILIFGVILLWNWKGIRRISKERYEIKRKYDLLDKKADQKALLTEQKKAAKAQRSRSTPGKMK